MTRQTQDLIVIGGGAAGFFGAITLAERRPGSRVVILEKSGRVLDKVRISGGGRCNVTHACFDPSDLVTHYPRGGKSLIGPFHRFAPGDTVDWFESRGVALKTEEDGRIFPTTDDSATIVGCLADAAEEAGVGVRLRAEVRSLSRRDEIWRVDLADGTSLDSRAILLATGGVRNGAGPRLAGELGHHVLPAAPSLFTFRIDDPRLADLAGVSVECVEAKIPGARLATSGPCLVTHWGLSGPAILKLSAHGARELAETGYRFELAVDWTGGAGEETVREALQARREQSPKRRVVSGCDGIRLPARLWKRLVEAAGVDEATTWSNLPREQREALVRQLVDGRFAVDGKSMNKDEFVTAGGVSLKEVDFRTLESRLHPGLHFAGEVLDIDGVTGGFNFQAAWTTGYLAGLALAES